MHTAKVLHNLLAQSAPSIHATRLNSVIASVQALTQGARATVTSLGRGLMGKAYDKHKIKRVDRLLSNAQLYQERHSIYCALTRRLLLGLSQAWVLVASLSLRKRAPQQIVRIYKTRMQIEEGFRDCKSVHYGLCLSQNRRMNLHRRSVLCLIAACTIFVLWCIGVAGQQTEMAKQVRVNSSSKRAPYSAIFLARLLIAQAHFRLPDSAINGALVQVKIYMTSVLCK